MKRDRLSPRRTDKDIRAILELIVEVRRAWEEAADLGAYGSGGDEPVTLGRGFSDNRPTENRATAPTKKQVRHAAMEAASLISDARGKLKDASNVLHWGLLRTDPEVLEDFLTKRAMALDK